jgi:hypothetical protein
MGMVRIGIIAASSPVCDWGGRCQFGIVIRVWEGGASASRLKPKGMANQNRWDGYGGR